MEAVSPVERRWSGKGLKEQGGQKSHRSPLRPQENKEPNAMAAEPVGGWAGQPRGPSVLECKVRALKEKRMLSEKQALSAGPVSQERFFQKKTKSRRSKPAAGPLSAPSQDHVVAPQAQMRTYLTDRLLDSSDDLDQGPVHSPPANSKGTQFPNQLGLGKESQRLSEGVWKPPDSGLLQEASYFQESPTQTSGQNRSEIPGPCRDVAQMLSLDRGALAEHQVQVGVLDEMSLAVEGEDPIGTATLQGHLWKAHSWDSLRNVSHSLSLADRVERNRILLQERRGLSEPSCSQHHQGGPPARAPRGTTSELLGGDLDWDSGVSLQDSDGCRAFVPRQELLLSPRHEQAQRLLQQARMKARTSPLRASHDIVPAVAARLPGRDAGCGAGQTPRLTLTSRDGDAPYGGSLSDSSSGESSCGQRRNRGPSPSRVRFEDESAQDAEVRYLERSQQPPRRALDAVLRSLGQGPLVSKPDLSNYINGDFQARESPGDGASWASPSKGSTGGLGKRNLAGKMAELKVEGTCHACGSYLQGLPRDPELFPAERKMPLGRSHSRDREDARCGRKGQGGSQTEPSAARGPASPVWILPSRQRLHTEHIRETYIGRVSYPDEADSAVDSTDTSDSCRTDSEEAGTPHRRSRGRARGSGPPRGRRATGPQRQGREPHPERAEGARTGPSQAEAGSRLREPRSAPEGSSLPKEDHGPRFPVPEAESISKEARPPLVTAGQSCKWAPPGDTQAPSGAPNATASCQQPALSVPGVEAQILGSQEPLKSAAASQPPNHVSPTRRPSLCSPQQAKKPAQPFKPGTWVPTPPPAKKASSPVPYRKAVLARNLGPDSPRNPAQAPQLSPRENEEGMGGEPREEIQPGPPKIKELLLVPGASTGPGEPQDSPRDRKEKGPARQESEPSPGKSRDGRREFWARMSPKGRGFHTKFFRKILNQNSFNLI